MSRHRKLIQLAIAEGDRSKLGKFKLEEKLGRTPPTVPGLPDPPEHLTGRAREAYEHWRSELTAMQLDARADAVMLEGASVAYQRAVDADAIVAREGVALREPVSNRLKKHPAVTISKNEWTLVRSFCSEFGLSPAARARLAVALASESVGDVEKVLSGPMLSDEENARF